MSAQEGNKGHRSRLKERFNNSPSKSIADYELLELMLYYAIPRRDTKSIAKSLLKRFGSLSAVLAADHTELKAVKGVSDSTITYLKVISECFGRVCFEPVENTKSNILNNWASVLNYCYLTMSFKNAESFRILYLNKKNVLLADELLANGTIDRIAIYPREIAKQALSHNASAVIVVHNHPSGDVSPSSEDVTVTKQLQEALKALGIVLHDHIIVSKGTHFSFKANNLI